MIHRISSIATTALFLALEKYKNIVLPGVKLPSQFQQQGYFFVPNGDPKDEAFVLSRVELRRHRFGMDGWFNPVNISTDATNTQ